MSTPHFSSMGPSLPLSPLIRPMSEATPNTLHDGYSLQASRKTDLSPPPAPLFLSESFFPGQPLRVTATVTAKPSQQTASRFMVGSFLAGSHRITGVGQDS